MKVTHRNGIPRLPSLTFTDTVSKFTYDRRTENVEERRVKKRIEEDQRREREKKRK